MSEMALDLKSKSETTVSLRKLNEFERKPITLKRQRILEEEKYVEAVDQIIQRDYFPDLQEMKLKQEYLDALENNDIEKARQIELEYHREMVVATEKTDSTLDSPVRNTECGGIGESKKGKISKGSGEEEIDVSNTGLDAFLSKTTSEDNASFEIIMEEARKKHKEKFSWLYEKEDEQGRKQQEMLALPEIGFNTDFNEGKPLNLDTWTYKPKNSLMYVPEGAPFSADELVEKSRKKGQEIMQKNTRFEENPFDSDSSKSLMLEAAREHSVARKALGKVGVDGKVEHFSDSPMVNGYGFVATPSPAPGVDASPLMTWGEIEGTPMRLDATPQRGNMTPGPSFKIPDAPRREKLGHALAEQVGKQYREKRQKAVARAAATLGRSPSRFGIDRQGTLSPAAQNLLKSSVRVSSDRALRSSYSPSPRSKTPGSTTPSTRTTPKSARTLTPHAAQNDAASSLTDNLLQLPKT